MLLKVCWLPLLLPGIAIFLLACRRAATHDPDRSILVLSSTPMLRVLTFAIVGLLSTLTQAQSPSSDPVAKAISQGDLFQSKRKYELALDAYHKADKLSHHSSA